MSDNLRKNRQLYRFWEGNGMEQRIGMEKNVNRCRTHRAQPIFRALTALCFCLLFVMSQKTIVCARTETTYEYQENETGITIAGIGYDYDEILTVPEEIDGKKVTEIGEYALSGKYDLKKVILPATIRTIGRGAFFHDENLSAVKLEKPTDGHEIRIESLAMAECPILSSLALPSNVTYLADDFARYSSCTVLGTQSWSEEHLWLYIETEHDASYVIERISSENRSGRYWRSVEDELDAPQNVKCYSASGGIGSKESKLGVTWNHVAGADAYQVYRSVGGEPYQYLATVADNFFVEDYVQKNKQYIYKIKAVGAVYETADLTSGTIGWDSIGSVLTDIRNVHAVPLRKDAVTLSWNARDDAVDGYYIYQKKGNTWKKIKEVPREKNFKDAKRSVTISGLKCGKKYTFAVQSYRDAVVYSCSDYQTYTTTVLVRPAATEIKKITKTSGGYNRVQWECMCDASGYVVYRSASKNGKYQKIAVTGSRVRGYVVDKNVKKGQKYYYKVAAYRNVNGKKIRSKVSAAVRS